ncbi:MAG: hypothetical protein ACKOEC_14000, partial [Acidimicrobiia bacterium]
MRFTTKLAAFSMVLGVSLSAAPSPDVVRVREWRAKNERQILAELIQLVSLPNIASNKADIAKNADLLTTLFERRGFSVKRISTPGSPVVYAERVAQNARGALTFYFHYDGQPTEANDWTIGQPFAPVAMLGNTRVDPATAASIDPDTRIYA